MGLDAEIFGWLWEYNDFGNNRVGKNVEIWFIKSFSFLNEKFQQLNASFKLMNKIEFKKINSRNQLYDWIECDFFGFEPSF